MALPLRPGPRHMPPEPVRYRPSRVRPSPSVFPFQAERGQHVAQPVSSRDPLRQPHQRRGVGKRGPRKGRFHTGLTQAQVRYLAIHVSTEKEIENQRESDRTTRLLERHHATQDTEQHWNSLQLEWDVTTAPSKVPQRARPPCPRPNSAQDRTPSPPPGQEQDLAWFGPSCLRSVNMQQKCRADVPEARTTTTKAISCIIKRKQALLHQTDSHQAECFSIPLHGLDTFYG